MTDLRAITVRDPWAWAIAVAATDPTAKLIENRGGGFPANYRGELLIHTGLAWSERGAADDRISELWARHGFPEWSPGCVVAVAELVDVHDASGCCAPWGEAVYRRADGSTETAVRHLVLERVRRLATPVRARGALGLWRPSSSVVSAVSAQLAPPCSRCSGGDCGLCLHGWPALPASCGCHELRLEPLAAPCPDCGGDLDRHTIETRGRLDSPEIVVACRDCSYEDR